MTEGFRAGLVLAFESDAFELNGYAEDIARQPLDALYALRDLLEVYSDDATDWFDRGIRKHREDYNPFVRVA